MCVCSNCKFVHVNGSNLPYCAVIIIKTTKTNNFNKNYSLKQQQKQSHKKNNAKSCRKNTIELTTTSLLKIAKNLKTLKNQQ